MNAFNDPSAIEIDANDTMYIADHHNYRVQMWTKGASTGVKIIDTTGADHPEGLTFDNNSYLYLTGHEVNRVVRYSPDFSSSTNVAGVYGVKSSAGTNHLNDPLGMDLDENLYLYIAERSNTRVVKWAPNGTVGSIVISATKKLFGIVLSRYSTNQAYVSSEEAKAVYLWTFNAPSPSITLTQVSSSSNLDSPRGLQYDIYNNLYVADRTTKRIIMYCPNATIGRIAVFDNTALKQPYDLAFDSDLNMFVLDGDGQKVLKYTRL